MKIGFFTDGYLPQINGVATSVYALKESLNKIGHQTYVVAPKFPKFKDTETDVFRLKSLRIYKNPELRLSYMFPDRIFQRVLKVDFDIIHGFSGGAIPSLGLALAKFKRKPYVFTYNTRLTEYTHYFLGGKLIRPKAVEKIVELYCNVCDYVIAPADYVKDELIEFGVKKPIAVIPNGVDTNQFRPGKSDFIKEKFGLKADDKILLYVGRVAKEKSIDFLIRSFVEVSKKNKNVYFAIVGDGQEKESLEKLAKKLGVESKVFFLGFVPHDKLVDVYNSADIFIFASTTETQGLVILEAMASGLPVIAVKDRVFSEFIETGVDAFIVENDQNLFADKINLVLADSLLKKEITGNARKKAEIFSLEKIALKFEALYKELI